MRPFYRVWQFWQVVTAGSLDKKAQAEIKEALTPQQRQLFGRFSASEQQHSYRVFSALRRAGHDDPDLLVAALLHDVGKTQMPRLWWYRPVVVLAQAFVPNKAAGWAQSEATWFTRPFIIKAHHAQWGAVLAETAAATPATVALIRHHHHSPPPEMDNRTTKLLSLLQSADDNS